MNECIYLFFVISFVYIRPFCRCDSEAKVELVILQSC